MFRKFDDEEMKMVVFMHVDDVLDHVEAATERFATEAGEKNKVKLMVEKFRRRRGKQNTSFFGGVNPLS